MGKLMEAIFCILYLISGAVIGICILKKGNRTLKPFLYGIMALVLVFGDAFHLIPRILVVFQPNVDHTVALGIGKMITSITMTVFYVMLFAFYKLYFAEHNKKLTITMLVLAAVRIVLCLLPQNRWTGDAPVLWGIIRNIPFTAMGLITVALWLKRRKTPGFRWMWFAVLFSFLFYLPVVLWADAVPMIGMLMIPKTCMYVWILAMGLKNVDRMR